MKVIIVVLSLAYLYVNNAYPTADPANKDEVEIVPLEDQFSFNGPPIIDTGISSGPFSSNPFNGFFQGFEDLMTRIRQQMNSLLKGIHDNSTEEEFSHIPGFPSIDLNKGNTTSVTKVINGHKVVINETEYKEEGDFGGVFYKVRVFDVKPENGTEINESTITDRDVEQISDNKESVENSFENEIPKIKEKKDIQTFVPMDSTNQNFQRYYENWRDNSNEWSVDDNIHLIEDQYYPKPVDLSKDTYVNEILAESGAPHNPNAEIFDVSNLSHRVPR